MYGTYQKKSTYKWTHTVQTCYSSTNCICFVKTLASNGTIELLHIGGLFLCGEIYSEFYEHVSSKHFLYTINVTQGVGGGD